MTRVTLSILLVLVIIFVVPFLVYALFAAFGGLKAPEGASAARFLTSVLIQKIGVAAAFVLIFYIARSAIGDRWLLYAGLWLLLFLFGEIGQALGPNYSWKEAFAGMISEVIYTPLSAYVLYWLIGRS